MNDTPKIDKKSSTKLDFDFGLSVDLEGKIANVDLSKYRAMVDVPGASEEEIMALLQISYQLVEELVEYGWGRSPVQLVCGKVEEEAAQGSAGSDDVLRSQSSSLTEKFNTVAAE